jgi:hypothetical protein
VAFTFLGGFFALSLNAGLFKESTAAGFTDNACLFNFLAEPPHQAFKAFPFMQLYLSQLVSTPSVCKFDRYRS